jgi:hypothetical protein
MRGNKILERLSVQDSNTPHSCDYRYKMAKKIVEQYPDSDFKTIAHPDLNEKLEEKIKKLIEFIKNSNHIDPN